MALEFEASFVDLTGDFGIVNGYFDPIKEAATLAMRELTEVAKKRGRARIGQAGFSRRWENALRGETYPERGFSANAVSFLYHRIPYAGVFEEGARIRGKPYLWVPLSSTPRLGRRKKLTPQNFSREFGPLVPMQGKRPMLGAPVSVTKAAAKKGGPYRVSKAALRRGAADVGIIRTAPVFIGVDTVNIRKRFNLKREFDIASRQLPALYLKNLKAE